MVEALDVLGQHREACGIKPENKFLFASTGFGPIQTWKTLHAVAVEVGCSKPELINSSGLRKYIATVVQV